MDNLQGYNTTQLLVQYSIAFYLRSKVTDHSLLAELPETYQIPRRNPTDLQSLIAKLCIDTKNQSNEFFDRAHATGGGPQGPWPPHKFGQKNSNFPNFSK